MRSIIKVIEDTPLGKEWSDEMRKLYGGNYVNIFDPSYDGKSIDELVSVNILARGIEGFDDEVVARMLVRDKSLATFFHSDDEIEQSIFHYACACRNFFAIHAILDIICNPVLNSLTEQTLCDVCTSFCMILADGDFEVIVAILSGCDPWLTDKMKREGSLKTCFEDALKALRDNKRENQQDICRYLESKGFTTKKN